jgi:hypothetical protein
MTITGRRAPVDSTPSARACASSRKKSASDLARSVLTAVGAALVLIAAALAIAAFGGLIVAAVHAVMRAL